MVNLEEFLFDSICMFERSMKNNSFNCMKWYIPNAFNSEKWIDMVPLMELENPGFHNPKRHAAAIFLNDP